MSSSSPGATVAPAGGDRRRPPRRRSGCRRTCPGRRSTRMAASAGRSHRAGRCSHRRGRRALWDHGGRDFDLGWNPPAPRPRCCCSAAAATPPPSAASTAPATCRRRATPTWSRGPAAAKAALGDRVFVLGHHYQRDEVIQFADVTGDSFKLAREAAARPGRGVHRLLRRALHGRERRHPDQRRAAGDPARPGRRLLDGRHGGARPGRGGLGRARPSSASPTSTVPVTYMNSSADIKGFVGRHGGVVCTSSNAKRALRLGVRAGRAGALPARPAPGPQHRGAARWASTLDDCVLYDPHKPDGGLTAEQLRDAKMILWRGHCSVHGRFTLDSVDEVRERVPGRQRAGPPRVPARGGDRGRPGRARPSTSSRRSRRRRPARRGRSAPSSTWSAGWRNAHPDKQIMFLDRTVCYCSTMNRIDLPHLVWALEELVAGRVPNQITVDPRDRPLRPGRRWTRCSPCRNRAPVAARHRPSRSHRR